MLPAMRPDRRQRTWRVLDEDDVAAQLLGGLPGLPAGAPPTICGASGARADGLTVSAIGRGVTVR
jgi:hypothetical protein